MLLVLLLTMIPALTLAKNQEENLKVVEVNQSRTVSGTVYDDLGEPLAGANITEKGTSNGTVSDSDGRFTLTLKTSNPVLTVSYLGYSTREVAVGSLSSMEIILTEDAQALDEVVVVGYGVQKKVNLSGAVQAVSAEKIDSRPVTNANLALQGLAANVNISMLDGRANSAPDINVRGYTSINGGSALILVDNVPVSSDELSRLNPSDIESMSVLKDAASSAIYGGRAAFGVILITTKSAKSNKLDVSFDGNFGVRQLERQHSLVTDVYELITTQQALTTRQPLWRQEEIDYVKKMVENPEQYPSTIISEWGQTFYPQGSWMHLKAIDWNKVYFREASPSYTGNVRVGQKTERVSYSASLGYYKQDGMLNHGNDVFDRYNLRGNGTFKLTDRWQIGTNIAFSNSKYDAPEVMDEDFIWQLYSDTPMRGIINPDGSWTAAGAKIIGLYRDGGRRIQITNETQVSLNTTVDVLKDVWQVKADANYRFTNDSYRMSHYPVYYRVGPDQPLQAQFAYKNDRGLMNSIYAENGSGLRSYQVYNLYTDFHKTFAEKHYVQALLGYNQESLRDVSSWVRKADLISQSLPTTQLATGTIQTGETIRTLALRGAFARLNYIFDNKYIVEFNGRQDITSRYAKGQRTGYFPSTSLAWVISREKFLAPLAEQLKVDQLKLRGSYGSLGNQVSSSYYPYIATMSAGAISVPVNGVLPMAVNQPGVVSGSLTWETVKTLNGGIDLSLLNNRVNIGFDMYKRATIGMLVQSKTLPAVFGSDPPVTNAGDLETKGWELTLGLKETFRFAGKPLHLGLDFMLADSRSFITKYDNETRGISKLGNANYYEGQELGEIWGFVTDGFLTKDDLVYDENGQWTGKAKIDQTDVMEDDSPNSKRAWEGDLKFKDLNGDGKITFGNGTVSDPGDRKVIGNDRARFPFSVTLTADWNNIDFRAFIQGVGKRDWYPGANHILFWGMYARTWSLAYTDFADHWTPENPNAKWPRPKAFVAENSGELGWPQTGYLQDASYARLKNLTIGYTLPKNLTHKLRIERLRLYLSGENLFTLDHIDVKGVDPEGLTYSYIQYRERAGTQDEGSAYPMQRVFSFGINLNF